MHDQQCDVYVVMPQPPHGAADYLVVAGKATVIGKQPDGDSVRFLPDDPSLLAQLEHGDRLRRSTDGTVQLRFDGVDAPELHYQGRGQPQGASARDALLMHLGFSTLTYATDGMTVTGARPTVLPVVILARMVELNGRPVAVLYSGAAADRLSAGSGSRVELDPDLLSQSVNAWETSAGIVYPLLYNSTAEPLREVFVALARRAREQCLGVWPQDSSAGFSIADFAAVGPTGALVMPKLFRRVVDYLRRPGGESTLAGWLQAHSDTEDDQVIVGAAAAAPLHTLVGQTAAVVSLLPDILDLVFLER